MSVRRPACHMSVRRPRPGNAGSLDHKKVPENRVVFLMVPQHTNTFTTNTSLIVALRNDEELYTI